MRMVDEVLPQFKRMWAENEYRFDGEFFSMPPRNVLPKPLQDPHPPMWMAAGNPGTFEKAARHGARRAVLHHRVRPRRWRR